MSIENQLVKESEKEPIASLTIDIARHSLKGSEMPGGRVPLSAKGMEAAVETGAAGSHAEVIEEKASRGEELEVYGSLLERTQQSSAMRMLGKQFKDAKFENADPEDVMRWLETGGVEKKESTLLSFQLGEGEYNKEFMDKFKKGVYLQWLVERSNEAALEFKQNPEKVTPLNIQSGNVASFLWALGKMKTDELAKSGGEKKEDIAFATTHQGILESFLYKVLKMRDEKAAEEFVKNKPNGFKENEGMKVKFNLLGDGIEDFNMDIEYDGKNYQVNGKEVISLIQEGIDFKEKLAKQ